MAKITVHGTISMIVLVTGALPAPALGEGRNFDELFSIQDTIRLPKPKAGAAMSIHGFTLDKDDRISVSTGPPGDSEVWFYNSRSQLAYVIRDKDIGPIRGYPCVYFKALAFGRNSETYISESVSGKVAVVDTAGKFLSYFAPRDDHNCRAGASDMEIDEQGYVYLGGPCYQEADICPEARDFCIHKYDPKGNYVRSFFPFDKGLFELVSSPSEDVHLDLDQEGNIWCVHNMVYQVFKYSPEGELLAKFPGQSSFYEPPTKFSDTESEQARRTWQTSWSKINNLVALEPNLILLSLITHSTSKSVVEIYNLDGDLLESDIQTNHRLLGKDRQGFVYFLLDGYDKDKWSDEFRIGRFSVTSTDQSKSHTR